MGASGGCLSTRSMEMMGQKRLDARIIKASIGDLHSCTLIMLMAIKFCMTLCATWASLPLCLLAVPALTPAQ